MSAVKELPEERLASTDEKGKRVFLHPADVKGKYKKYRNVVHAVLMVVFLVLPWIKLNGHQAVLLDIANRRFSIFGLAFWAHDAPMLWFVFLSVFFAISLITAVWGRLWCGWGCPETVFVESLYRRIERWIEGNHIQRRRLEQAPWGPKKLGLKAAKWSAFLVVTLILTHSFMAYFIGTEKLAKMSVGNPMEHPTAFTFMLISTAIILFSFGWFREQFCIILCPYGRFQSVLMDDDSMVVAYDVERGEPRRGPDVPKEEQGDCISCYKCVQVCPTGVDIRRGVQMECIACTACIDACNEVMLNIKKPEGLIRYTTEHSLKHGKTRHFRVRVVLLSAALVAVLSGLTYVLMTRPPVKAKIFTSKTAQTYQVIQEAQDPILTNTFFMNAANYTFEDGSVKLEAQNSDIGVITQLNPIQLAAGEEKKISFFLKFPKSVLQAGRATVKVDLLTKADNGKWERKLTQEVPLAGPY